MGLIIDTFGRKTPVVMSLIISGACFIAIPMCKVLYPDFLILRCLIGMGAVVIMNIPLVPDYV